MTSNGGAQDLHNIPIETIGVSERATRTMQRIMLNSVGDCIDWLRKPADGEVVIGGLASTFNEVVPRLKELGFLPPDLDYLTLPDTDDEK